MLVFKDFFMLDPGSMSIEELEAFIESLPDNSPCARGYIEKLKAILQSKKDLENING